MPRGGGPGLCTPTCGVRRARPRACSRTQVLDPQDLLCARQVPALWEAEPQVGTVSPWGAHPEGETVSGDAPPFPPHAPRAFFWKDPVSGFPSQPKPGRPHLEILSPAETPFPSMVALQVDVNLVRTLQPFAGPYSHRGGEPRTSLLFRAQETDAPRGWSCSKASAGLGHPGASAVWFPEDLGVTGFSRKGHWLELEVSSDSAHSMSFLLEEFGVSCSLAGQQWTCRPDHQLSSQAACPRERQACPRCP